MKNILVYSKKQIPDLKPNDRWAIIQIDTNKDWPDCSSEGLMGCLQLTFPDDESDFKHAKTILKFVKNMKPRIDTLIVHCEMGISRSAAVAGAISKIYYDNDFRFFEFPYCPNMKIYRTILEEYYG